MLIAAAVCPHPPLLVPRSPGPMAPARTDPAQANSATCGRRAATRVAVLLGAAPDLLVVAGGAGRRPSTRHSRGQPARLRGPVHRGYGPRPAALADHRKWLLAGAASPSPPAAWQAIASGAAAADCLSLGEKLAALAPRVALLAMGDGPGGGPAASGSHEPGRRPLRQPGDRRPGRRRPGALAALDPGRDQELFVAGRAAWQVLAGAASAGAFTADLRYAAAPFEVSYYVATWVRAH
jgi:hypothetical protein